MFGKKYLEIAAISSSLLALNCADDSAIQLGNNFPNAPQGDQAGSGGSTEYSGLAGSAGHAGIAGKAGHAGHNGMSGFSGQVNSGNSDKCNLVSNLSVSAPTFNPAGVAQQISLKVAKASNLSVAIKSGDQLIKVLDAPIGQAAYSWNGKDSQGINAVDGLYRAEVIATQDECVDQESIAFKVKNGVVECLLKVFPASSVYTVVAEGEPSVELACFMLRNGECEVDLKALSMTNQGHGEATKHLLNNRLTDANHNFISGNYSNFSQDRVSFKDDLILKIAQFEERKVCLTSDLSPNSDGDAFRMSIISPADLTATSPDSRPVIITGEFPVSGPDVTVTYSN